MTSTCNEAMTAFYYYYCINITRRMFFFPCNDIIETEDKLIKNNHYSVFLQWQVSSYLSVLITELFHIYQTMIKRGI